ncbi:MAG: phage tail assembly protein T [Candidatus Thorarchaeota archaeon]
MDELTSEQVGEWMAYDSIDPIGKYRDDYGWAKVCSVMYNLALAIYSKKGAHPKQATPSDFIPDWNSTRRSVQKVQSVETQKAILLELAKRHNRIHRKKGKRHG